MTKAKNKEDWIKAWHDEASYLFRAYQCEADPEVYELLKSSINKVQHTISLIGERMEIEGVWKNE